MASFKVGDKVRAAKATRHGIVPKGTVGTVVEIQAVARGEGGAERKITDAAGGPAGDIRVAFPGQSMTFLFPNDRTTPRYIVPA